MIARVPAAPVAELLELPEGYGKPRAPLAWERVHARLVDALRYWLATVRPDGRPHVVPVDGVWLDDACWFGGHPDTVKLRNLRRNPKAVIHLEPAERAVIVEGACEELFPDGELAVRLARLSNDKYGWGPKPAEYTRTGAWCLRPERVLGWERFPLDATRFLFRHH
jgi:nitroimidazol reductase NimA-like FMN-containing flavoprotein (pyridoxamine 5'-phosphate oxidase superfamily)